jgi:hypothetical protein
MSMPFLRLAVGQFVLKGLMTMSALISTEANNKNITPHLASVSCLSLYQAIPLVCPDELTL